MSFDIHNYTDNFMTVKGDKAEEFFNSFQHVVEEASFLINPEIKQINYNFRYHGALSINILLMLKRNLNLKFELKGYFYPDEYDLGFKILIFSNSLLRYDLRAFICLKRKSSFQDSSIHQIEKLKKADR